MDGSPVKAGIVVSGSAGVNAPSFANWRLEYHVQG
jgi:hypothetical protein